MRLIGVIDTSASTTFCVDRCEGIDILGLRHLFRISNKRDHSVQTRIGVVQDRTSPGLPSQPWFAECSRFSAHALMFESGWVGEYLDNSAIAVIQILWPWMSCCGTDTDFLHCRSRKNDSVS